MAILESTNNPINFNFSTADCPHTELAAGRDDGMRTALWDIRDQAEFTRLLACLDRNRTAFLVELRSAKFVIEGGVSGLPLDKFEDLMFGHGAGGVHGPYAQGFLSSFAALAPFVRTLH